MITGPNTHNQSIERLWRDVFDGVIGFYYELFSFMEENGILDPFNEVDIAALHFTFIPLINEKLDAWWQAWSKHRIRTIKTSPLRLWAAGQINCPLDLMSEDQLRNFGVEGILTDEEIDERPIITSPTDILTEIVLTQLNAEVPFESKPENYEINNFIKAREIVALFVWFFLVKETILSIFKAVEYICRQILTSSLPNKIEGTCSVTEKWNINQICFSQKLCFMPEPF